MGDWVNVLEHQKAAYAMLLQLYTVDSIMDVEIRRKILAWYSRFDLYAGLMSGYEMVLGREWFCANESYYQLQSRRNPSSTDCNIEAAIASHRVLAMDMALLFAKLPRGEISIEEFIKENELIAERFRTYRRNLAPLVDDQRYLVYSFQTPRERDPEDIVDPYLPYGLYKGALWTVNFMLIDWLGLDVMHRYQTALMLKQQPPPELENMALELCRLFETIEYWSESPPGSVLKAQAGLGIATLFLPRDQRHVMWCRRKMAMIEAQGYDRDLPLPQTVSLKERSTMLKLYLGISFLQASATKWRNYGAYLTSAFGGSRKAKATHPSFATFDPLSKTGPPKTSIPVRRKMYAT